MVKWTAIALAGAIALAAPTAQAQPSKDDVAQARAFFKVAGKLLDKGRYDEAIRALRKAFGLSKRSSMLINIGFASSLKYTEDKSEETLRAAVSAYREYLAVDPQGADKHVAIKKLAELEPLLPKPVPVEPEGADLDPDGEGAPEPPKPAPQPPPLRTALMITSPIDGATIALDGKALAKSLLVADVTPGKHTVTVSAPGYKTATRNVLVERGSEMAFDMGLTPLKAELQITGPAGAAVWIDGRPSGSLPLVGPVVLDAGAHFVALTDNGRHAFSRSVALGRGEASALDADMAVTNQRYLAWSAFAGAGVSVLLGAGFTIGAVLANDEAADILARKEAGSIPASELPAYDDARTRRDDLRIGAGVAFGLGAALVGTGAVLYIFDEPPVERAPSNQLTISLAPSFIGVGGGF